MTFGVDRRGGGGLKKLSGVSFQLVISLAWEGGGSEGELVKLRGEGPVGLGCIGPKDVGGGTIPDCCLDGCWNG